MFIYVQTLLKSMKAGVPHILNETQKGNTALLQML